MPRASPVAIRAWVRGRPLEVRSGVSSVRASRLSSWPYASSTVPRSGQPSFARQSFTYDRDGAREAERLSFGVLRGRQGGVDGAVEHEATHPPGELLGVPGAQVGAVGGAVVGEHLVAEHRAQHVHVVHRADRVEVGQRGPAPAPARLREGRGLGHQVLHLGGSVGGGVGGVELVELPVVQARHRRGVPGAPRIPPDEVERTTQRVTAERRSRQLDPARTADAGAARVHEQ